MKMCDVLIVDDDPFSCELLERQLAMEGISTIRCHSCGRAGLEDAISTSGENVLIFLDLQMPDLDGIEFIRALAKNSFNGELVLLSGEHRKILQAALRLARAHGLKALGATSKPIDGALLRSYLTYSPVEAQRASLKLGNFPAIDFSKFLHAMECGEVSIHYQPKVAFQSGALLGVEALVRWNSREYGSIAPDHLVEFLENSDYTRYLTRFVLTKALRQLKEWDRVGLKLKISINISMNDLSYVSFPDVLESISSSEGIDLRRLTLELTETRFMRNPIQSIDTLSRLRLKGVGLSMDDYGMGHSSLAQLRDIPFDELKLDQSFVFGSPQREDLQCILESTVKMARTLELNTVAEGVETLDEWRLLKKLGCHQAQGWFIGRAMPGNSIVEWNKSWEERCINLVEK